MWGKGLLDGGIHFNNGGNGRNAIKYFSYITYSSLVLSILTTWPKHVELATTNGAGMNGASVGMVCNLNDL